MEKIETRRQAYERRRTKLEEKCRKCQGQENKTQTPERCEECIVGWRLRSLETEYSDITGWSHRKWDK